MVEIVILSEHSLNIYIKRNDIFVNESIFKSLAMSMATKNASFTFLMFSMKKKWRKSHSKFSH